jgi:integrase
VSKQLRDADASGFIRIGDKVQIRPRGKRGIYIAEFFHDGQHRRRSLKTARLDLAHKRAIALEADLAGGEYKARPKLVALAAAQDDFLAVKRGEGIARKTEIKYGDWLDAFVAFAATRDVRFLQQCTPALFEQFRAERQKGQSPKSMETGLTIVKQFFNFFSGRGRDVFAVSPVARCKVPAAYVHPQFTPTLDQVNAILGAAKGDRRLQFAVAAFTGLREEEIAMLAPSSVDLTGGWVHVKARMGWVPKTRQARKVPVHPRLAAILAEVCGAADRPYYFCAPPSKQYRKCDHHLNVRQVNEDLQRVAKSLGIPTGRKANGLVFHSLRHFFETQAVDSGVPQFVVDAWMGHSSGGTMGRLYYGLTDAKSQAYMGQVKF